MNRLLFGALLAVCLNTLLTDVMLSQGEGKDVDFKWGFGAVSDASGKRMFSAVTKDTTLSTGDELKMFVELQSDCFVYVVYRGSTGDIDLLFPYDLKQFDTDYTKGKQYYIPKGRSWFSLVTPVGEETFYLLASSRRLTELESRLERYTQSSKSEKKSRAKEVLAEIRDLKKRHMTLRNAVERPVSIGGNVRGLFAEKGKEPPDVATIAVEISGAEFYGKTFTIDHR